jgi:hypothetical protein
MSLINRICEQLRFQHHLSPQAVRRAINCAVYNTDADTGRIAARDRDTIPPKSFCMNALKTQTTAGLTTKRGQRLGCKPGAAVGRSHVQPLP